MESIKFPLIFSKGHLIRTDLKESIDNNVDLLLSTPCFSCPSDPDFGFIFNNMRFEIFNENDGVVYNSSSDPLTYEGKAGLYEKKISGSSKNLNTFASELKDTIAKFEPRLTDINVSMTYIREEKLIYIYIKGVIKTTEEPYSHNSTLKVWK